MNRYGIGYNKTLGVYFTAQDMIDYHKYKMSVLSDESSNYHEQMIKKIKKFKENHEKAKI